MNEQEQAIRRAAINWLMEGGWATEEDDVLIVRGAGNTYMVEIKVSNITGYELVR